MMQCLKQDLGPLSVLVHLFQSSLDAAVLARDPLAVPVVGRPARHAQVRVALPHRQVAGTLLCVALRLAPAAGEPVLAWKTQTEEGLQKDSVGRNLINNAALQHRL